MKRTLLKKLTSIVVLCSCIVATPACVFATVIDTQDTVSSVSIGTPRLTYISGAETVLEINSEAAVVDCWVKGNVLTATKAKVIAELQVKSSETNWIPVAIWTDTQNDYMASVYETKAINPENTYRVKATYTVWEGNQSETIIAYSN